MSCAGGHLTRVPWPLFKATIDLSHPSINNGILGAREGIMFVCMQSLTAHTQEINNVCGTDKLMDGKLSVMAVVVM
jgi:hypothetical protein